QQRYCSPPARGGRRYPSFLPGADLSAGCGDHTDHRDYQRIEPVLEPRHVAASLGRYWPDWAGMTLALQVRKCTTSAPIALRSLALDPRSPRKVVRFRARALLEDQRGRVAAQRKSQHAPCLGAAVRIPK